MLTTVSYHTVAIVVAVDNLRSHVFHGATVAISSSPRVRGEEFFAKAEVC